jgi:hypothetical protein
MLLDPGSEIRDPGSGIRDPGSRIWDPGLIKIRFRKHPESRLFFMSKRPDPGKKTRTVSGKPFHIRIVKPNKFRSRIHTLKKYLFFLWQCTWYGVPYIINRDATKILKLNNKNKSEQFFYISSMRFTYYHTKTD